RRKRTPRERRPPRGRPGGRPRPSPWTAQHGHGWHSPRRDTRQPPRTPRPRRRRSERTRRWVRVPALSCGRALFFFDGPLAVDAVAGDGPRLEELVRARLRAALAMPAAALHRL